MSATAWDVVVVGGGTAGMTAARAAAAEGASVLLIERAPHLGGECTYVGCVPSKTLIEVARTYWRARNATTWGISNEGLGIDFPTLMAHKDAVIADIERDEDDAELRAAGVEVAHAAATYVAANHVDVDGVTHRFERTVIATGSAPAIPPIPGLADTPHLTNETVFDVPSLPGRLLVLGGGAIGLELGQAFGRLGSEVTVVEQADRLLPIEDADTSAVVAGALAAEGLDLRIGWRVMGAGREDGRATLVVSGPDGRTETLTGDAVLVATGRRPRIEGFGMERLGVSWNRDGIAVDEHMRTAAHNVFACGDVTGGLRFTHVASAEGRVAGRNAAGAKDAVDLSAVPWVTFLEPEVGRVGLTEDEARATRSGVEVTRLPMSRVDRARILGETRGFIKLITARRKVLGRTGGGQLVGAHAVGPAAGELANEAALVMRTKAFAGRLAQSIHAYPTVGIGLQMSASQLFPLGRALVGADGHPRGEPPPGAE